ncbi:hypothetical protein BJP34_01010 [Moorena producens PAL-8-15-08-1]|uniref:Uncharacterized protein n=1 Tax=Moorena producens PAL-8-15-08-1 TaxID=1458985 RepID=A0A1D8TKR3_9CYAN|nr:hypothetical protein [Moorena producens]AOW98209.1 hypothetical protein BJP34_01010 [Moorena producens PAL-8-15-08-1]
MSVGELIQVHEQLHQFYPQATDIATQGCYNVGSLGFWFNIGSISHHRTNCCHGVLGKQVETANETKRTETIVF